MTCSTEIGQGMLLSGECTNHWHSRIQLPLFVSIGELDLLALRHFVHYSGLPQYAEGNVGPL